MKGIRDLRAKATIIPSPEVEAARNNPAKIERGTSLFEQFGYKFTRKLVGTGDADSYTNFNKTDKSSGTFVPTNDDIHMFDPDNPQHALINTWDQDAIYMYGLQMRYYRVKPQEEQTFFDPVDGENPSREYDGAYLERDERFAFMTEVSPTVVWGLYEMAPPDQKLELHGMDTTRTASIWFNRIYINSVLGRNPVIGDVVIPWDIPEQIYEVLKVEPDSYTLYVPRRWKLSCQLMQFSK